MITGDWTCTCTAVNDPGVRFCESCGTERKREAITPVHPPPAYREVQPVIRERVGLDARCTHPLDDGTPCGKSVREHIAEAKRIGASAAWGARFGSQR